MTNQEKTAPLPEVEALREEVGRTRAGMVSTLRALEDKLDPSDLRDRAADELEKVEVRVRAAVREELHEVKAVLKEEIQDAKVAVKEVLHTAKEDALALKESVKDDVQRAMFDAKSAARAATLGRLEDMATEAGDAMNDTKETLIDTVRQNPLPAALVGLGIAWLLMNRSTAAAQRRTGIDEGRAGRGREEGQGDRTRTRALGRGAFARSGEGSSGGRPRVSDRAGEAGEAASSMVDKVRETGATALDAVTDVAHDVRDQASSVAHRAADFGSHLAHDVQDKASHLWDDATHAGEHAYSVMSDYAHEVPRQARRAERAVEGYYMGNPLAVGAAVLATGALVGMVLPRTAREDALMGEARDHMLANAKTAAHDALDRAKVIGEETAEKVKGALGEASPA